MHNFTYIISLFLLFFSCENNEDITGCPDPEACNYNSNVNEDDDSCIYPEANYDCDGNCIELLDDCGICGGNGAFISSDWTIQIIASIEPWYIFPLIYDEENYLGVSDVASDEYDIDLDIPEPPTGGCTNCINAYFSHSEWDSVFSDNFTQEFMSNEFCNYKEWHLSVIANSNGPLELQFFQSQNQIPDELSVSFIYDNEEIILSDSTVISGIILDEDIEKEFIIKVSVN